MTAPKYASQRTYDIVVDGVIADRELRGSVADWLAATCGLRLAPLEGAAKHIGEGRRLLALVSREALRNEPFVDAMRAAQRESRLRSGLSFVVLRRDGVAMTDLPLELQGATSVALRGPSLHEDEARALLSAIYPADLRALAAAATHRDVYFSRSWLDDPTECAAADGVEREALRHGLRLIGDTEDDQFDPAVRLPALMAGCGGFVAVLPLRPGALGTSAWMLEELRIALQQGRPSLVAKHPAVTLPPALTGDPLLLATVDLVADAQAHLAAAFDLLEQRLRPPTDLADIVYLGRPGADDDATVGDLMQRISGMHFRALPRPLPEPASWLDGLGNADLVLCELAAADAEGWLFVGSALALARQVVVLQPAVQPAAGSVPRGVEVHHPADALGRWGRLHRIAWQHRRRILGAPAVATQGDEP